MLIRSGHYSIEGNERYPHSCPLWPANCFIIWSYRLAPLSWAWLGGWKIITFPDVYWLQIFYKLICYSCGISVRHRLGPFHDASGALLIVLRSECAFQFSFRRQNWTRRNRTKLLLFILKDFFQLHAKGSTNLEGERDRGHIFSLLKRNNGLSGTACTVG